MKYTSFLISACGFAALLGQAAAWTPGVYTSPMPSRDFTVDTQNRNDVVSFWHAIYQASEGYETRINWTGNYTAPDASGMGTTSNAFVRDVERRINFYRALTGIPADIAVNTQDTVNIFGTDAIANRPDSSTLKSEASQRSAYMIVRSDMANFGNGMGHNPPSNSPTWTTAAWNGSARSNITYGFFGPGAVDAYIQESVDGTSSWNAAVGHRRWILNLGATNFATGDTPGQFVYPDTIRTPTNSLYAIPKNSELAIVAARFIPYPSAGFFPAKLNTPFWSLGYPGANFTNATVEMRDAEGQLVNITKIIQSATEAARGNPSIVWQVNDPAATATTIGQDRSYDISVSGITGNGIPTSFQYTVTLINPDLLTSDQTLTGTTAPPATASASYFVNRPPLAEDLEVNVFNNSSAAWTENAETTSPFIINRTYGTYNFISSPIGGIGLVSGTKSFRLTHPVRYDMMTNWVPEQIFEISREILTTPTSSSTLNFKYKKGYMLAASSLAVEYTQDDGATWSQLGSPIQGVGATSMTPDVSALNWSGTLPKSATPYRVRFRFYKSGGEKASTFNHQDPAHVNLATGIFIDDITTANCTWLELKKVNEIQAAADRFVLDASTASEAGTPLVGGAQYHLRVRTKLGNKWFPYAPSKIVTATSSPIPAFGGWLAYEYPILTGGFSGDHDGDGVPNAVEYAFALDPLAPSVSADSIGFAASPAKAVGGPYISISRAANGLSEGVTAEWSDTLAPNSWSSEGISVTYSPEQQLAIATAPSGSGKRFLRWKITTP